MRRKEFRRFVLQAMQVRAYGCAAVVEAMAATAVFSEKILAAGYVPTLLECDG